MENKMQLNSCTFKEWDTLRLKISELEGILQKLTNILQIKLRGTIPGFINYWANCLSCHSIIIHRLTCCDEGVYHNIKGHVEHIEGQLQEWLGENTTSNFLRLDKDS